MPLGPAPKTTDSRCVKCLFPYPSSNLDLKVVSMYRIPDELANSARNTPQYWWAKPQLEVVLLFQEGELKAFSSICPHMGARLDVQNRAGRLFCPWHGLKLGLNDKACRRSDSAAQEFRLEKRGEEYWLDV